MSVNKVILVGRLGADPESRATPGGLQVSNLRLATNHVAYDRDGNKNESTEWHRVVFFGRTAEVCEQYLRKGSQIYVEGRIRTTKYTDRDGIERYSTEIVGERLQMLGGRDDQSAGSSEGWGGGASRGERNTGYDEFGQNSGPMPGAGASRSAPAAAPASAPKKPIDSFDELDDDLPF